ncbi:hypothetical protein Hsw_2116 [Hymenobacter swuensis DY53]|uniref:Uncharacterized protein n=1 Tax=Hymenobacter swuensis DY53 TaxID=1227739 RepID=W8F518_9BACT|nr:hypothetical protein Hsw_2116 [Hymenobacter swuensis DY53]
MAVLGLNQPNPTLNKKLHCAALRQLRPVTGHRVQQAGPAHSAACAGQVLLP